jgi:hypothetical protein
MANGLKLTWEQAHALGDEIIDWMRSRLGLKSSTTDRGITFKPDPSNRKHSTRRGDINSGVINSWDTCIIHKSCNGARSDCQDSSGGKPGTGRGVDEMIRHGSFGPIVWGPGGLTRVATQRDMDTLDVGADLTDDEESEIEE